MAFVKAKGNMIGLYGEEACSHEYIEELEEWLDVNCRGLWGWTTSFLTYDFDLDSDALLFKIRWG